MAEVNIYGVFFGGALIAAVVAIVALLVLRRLLGRTSFYAYVWHHSLVDLSLFVMLWAASTWVLGAASGMIR